MDPQASAAHPDLIVHRQGETGPRLLFLDPYLNASHKAFAHGLMRHLPARWTMLGLSGRHFRWRMRGAPLFLARAAGDLLARPWDGVVASGMLNLPELAGLCPGLAGLPSLVVFHENQLAYPAPGRADQRQQERDLYLAFANLSTAGAAGRVVFNSLFQQERFLAAGRALLAKLPDAAPPGLVPEIEAKSRHLPIPLESAEAAGLARQPAGGPLRLLWNHRWHQDKDPEGFFAALFELAEAGLDFRVAVLGNRPARPPAVFQQAAQRLGPRLERLGPEANRRDYWKWLFWADVVVSTARQENFGLSVAEAVWAGCRPLLPRALVYPELYPLQFLYPAGGLASALARLAQDPAGVRANDYSPLARDFTWERQAAAWQGALDMFLAKKGRQQ